MLVLFSMSTILPVLKYLIRLLLAMFCAFKTRKQTLVATLKRTIDIRPSINRLSVVSESGKSNYIVDANFVIHPDDLASRRSGISTIWHLNDLVKRKESQTAETPRADHSTRSDLIYWR